MRSSKILKTMNFSTREISTHSRQAVRIVSAGAQAGINTSVSYVFIYLLQTNKKLREKKTFHLIKSQKKTYKL